MPKTTIPIAALFALIALAPNARASARQQQEDFERRIRAELAARDPEGAELFTRASRASDRGDLDGAARLYEQVRERDPWFLHATRRLGGIESARGNGDRGVALAREAFDGDPSPVNEAALARAFLGRQKTPSEDDIRSAYGHARNAAGQAPGDAFVQMVLCSSSAAANEAAVLSGCTEKLKQLDPGTVPTLYFSAIDDASHQRLDEARSELERARVAGLPEDQYRALGRAIDDARSPLDRYGGIVLRGLAVWLGGFALLVGAGAILSRVTLRAVSRLPTGQDGRARGVDAALRRTYGVVLALTCAYYYASLPIVALAVLGLGGGLIYLCFAMGQVPVKLVLIVVLFVLWSLVAIARSLLVRARDVEPGERLDLRDHPSLRAVLDEVAARIGTRPVDTVFLTPGTEVAVLERGGLLQQMRGKSQRCLVLGAGVLEGMRVGELKAVLAHEYGHFHNEDTAGGGLALAVRRSLLTMAVHLAQRGVASPFNPAWWFVRGFNAVFVRVSQGASRLQEVLADRWAAFAYGSAAFVRGLEHVVSRSVRFDAHLRATIDEVVPARLAVQNVYTYEPRKPVDPKQVEKAVQEAMNRPASHSDSHPPPADRIAWVQRIAAAPPRGFAEDASEAWSLFASREALENQMTAVVRSRLARSGIIGVRG